mmetsp:Transcript_9737/g.20765  ORF Transcript_9737/g.20765 Transcript_9737/m.20765 type:complete len:202 (+) Transcript_9737:1440-2045(+)
MVLVSGGGVPAVTGCGHIQTMPCCTVTGKAVPQVRPETLVPGRTWGILVQAPVLLSKHQPWYAHCSAPLAVMRPSDSAAPRWGQRSSMAVQVPSGRRSSTTASSKRSTRTGRPGTRSSRKLMGYQCSRQLKAPGLSGVCPVIWGLEAGGVLTPFGNSGLPVGPRGGDLLTSCWTVGTGLSFQKKASAVGWATLQRTDLPDP